MQNKQTDISGQTLLHKLAWFEVNLDFVFFLNFSPLVYSPTKRVDNGGELDHFLREDFFFSLKSTRALSGDRMAANELSY